MSKNSNVNWQLINRLPADGVVYAGSPEYGAFKVCHVPATTHHVEHLLAETGIGLLRRRWVPKVNAPKRLAATELIAGNL